LTNLADHNDAFKGAAGNVAIFLVAILSEILLVKNLKIQSYAKNQSDVFVMTHCIWTYV